MGLIVKYHNDFNRIKLPSFKEQEMNLLHLILAKIKSAESGTLIRFEEEELLYDYGNRRVSREHFRRTFESLKTKFFKADFTILIDTPEYSKDVTINLFQEMTIQYKTKKRSSDNIAHIEFIVNPRFEYLVKEVLKNFTRFEFQEIMAVSGKHAKTLYRLLKQYKSTGYLRMDWEDFAYAMDIEDYEAQANIDKFVIKPAIKELSKAITIDGVTRIPFKNLNFKKLKERTRGRRVIGIEFSFDPQPVETDEQLAIKATQTPPKALQEPKHPTTPSKSLFEGNYNPKNNETQKPAEAPQPKREIPENLQKMGVGSYKPINARYVGQSYMRENGDVIRIADIFEINGGALEVIFINTDTREALKGKFPTENHLKSYLDKLVDLSSL